MPVNNFSNYAVSDQGEIKRVKDNKILKQRFNTRGYLIVGLRKEGRQTTFLVHRLVAIHFIPNPDNKAEVNHRLGIKDDNRASELEWMTRVENEEHARRVLGKKSLFSNSMVPPTGKDSHRAKSVVKECDGVVLKTYDFIQQVKEDGFSPAMVSHCCRGIRKTHKGFTWEYAQ